MRPFDDDDLVLYFYGEAEDPEAVRAALDASPELRSRYETLQRVLAAVDSLPVPERHPAYGAAVWARLQPRLHRRRWWSAGPRLALAGMAIAALLLVTVGFLAGRLWPRGEAELALTPAARERILAGTVAAHLERSERLLVEVANADPTPDLPVDLAAESAWARDLLLANRLYRQSARHTGRPRLAAFLDELEPFLLELAHTPAEPSPAELADLRRRIEDQALLFRMRVVVDRLERRLERQATTAPGKQTL